MALVSNILTQVFITLIAVAGVYVLTGLTGMFSLGQAAFMAIGSSSATRWCACAAIISRL